MPNNDVFLSFLGVLQSNSRLGENLKEELENVNVQLEGLRKMKAERMSRFYEVIDQLLKLSSQLGNPTDYLNKFAAEETDLSLQKLDELRRQLAELHNEKVGFAITRFCAPVFLMLTLILFKL